MHTVNSSCIWTTNKLVFCETFYLESKALIQIEEEEDQKSLEIFSFYQFYGMMPQFIMQFLKAVWLLFFFFFFVSFCAQNSCPGKG